MDVFNLKSYKLNPASATILQNPIDAPFFSAINA